MSTGPGKKVIKAPTPEGPTAGQRPPTLGGLLRALWPPLPVWRRLDATVVVVSGYTAVVVLAVEYLRAEFAEFRPHEWAGATTLLNGLVLGVLLGFRNKEAYERWWEGRKLWGQLVNDSRNLCLKAAALPGLSAAARADLRKLVPGFAVALKHRLRDEPVPDGTPGPAAVDKGDPAHVPLFLAGRVATVFQSERAAGRVTEVDVLAMDPHVRALMDVCGACERIKTTPIPLSYRSLLRHGLVLYLVTTPWLVAPTYSWWAVGVVALLAYFLLGIELTAEDVEEPFGRDGDDLSLRAYCDTIRRSVEQALRE